MQGIGNTTAHNRIVLPYIRPYISAVNSVTETIVETSASAFEQDVIQKSHEHLVLVDFWADWCGPCKALTPILENLLKQYSGQVVLAKVNTDEQQELAAKFGIRTLPTVFLFRDGKPVDQFMGVQPESSIKRIVDKYIVRESDKMLQQAVSLFDSGEVDAAIALLNQTIVEDPGNDRPKFVLCDWLLNKARYDEAKTVLASVSGEGKDQTEFRSLNARLELGSISATEQSVEDLLRCVEDNADNLAVRFQLAHQFIQDKRLTDALDQLIEIVRRDRSFANDAPRQTILRIFDVVGGKGELVSRYRSLLAQALN